MIKPQHLKEWDEVAALTLSWWGPWAVPSRYEIGKKQLQDEFRVHVVEGKYTLKDPQRIYEHPEARAEDLIDAFKDPSIKAIISSIWWEESIRLLPYIDFDVIRNNPKIFMWFSDSTITHFFCHKAWIVSFYWPAIMAWFWENCWLFPYMVNSVRKTLFSNDVIWELTPNTDWWTSEHLDWSVPGNQNIKRKLNKCTWRRWLQGSGKHTWETLWGCADVFPFIIWTSIWPTVDEWKWKILLLEPSEEQMPTYAFERIIRNLGSQGILDVISWILLWRAQLNYETNVQINYDETLLNIVNNEFWKTDLPLITNMDFGHTDPILTLPLWIKMEIDCDNKKISYLESWCL
jgi:muramoyltetrapeptide carboxypeptidase LdcA involved in peptidoglycan recycling